MQSAVIPAHGPKALPPLTKAAVKHLAKEIDVLIPNTKEDVMTLSDKALMIEKVVQLGDQIKEIVEARGECSPREFEKSSIHYTSLDLWKKSRTRHEQILKDHGEDTSASLKMLRLLSTRKNLSEEMRITWKKFFRAIDEIAKLENIQKTEDILRPEALFRRRKAAVRSTLEELGVEFSKGNLLYSQIASDADRDEIVGYVLAADLLVGSAKMFPDSWVKTSDAAQQIPGGIPLYPVSSSVRGFYHPDKEGDYHTLQKNEKLIMKPNNWVPDRYKREDSEMSLFSGAYGAEKDSFYYHTEYEYSEPKAGTFGIINDIPDGSGWEEVELYEDQVELYKHYALTDPNHVYNPKNIVKQWRRPKLIKGESSEKENRAIVSVNSNLVVDANKPEGYNKDAGERITIHEFFHRLTDTHPKLLQMQRAFLHIRINKGKENEEPLSYLYPRNDKRKNEVGYPKTFNAAYSGRVYWGDNNEIGTTGLEALYFGRYGGFVKDLSGSKEDPQYYSFMLGMLASSIGD